MKTIVTYKRYFTITDSNFSKLIFELHNFNKNLVTYSLGMDRSNLKGKDRFRGKGKLVEVVDKILYLVENKVPENPLSQNLIRYPISLHERLLTYLHNMGRDFDLKTIHASPQDGDDIGVSVTDTKTARPDQKVMIDSIVETKHSNMLLGLGTGLGKDLRNGTPVLADNKWVNIEDLKVGDTITGTSELITVLAVYPQGLRKQVRLTFTHKKSIDCGYEHLWKVRLTRGDMTMNCVITTETMLEHYDTDYYEIYIPTLDIYDEVKLLSHESIGEHHSTCITVSSSDSLFVTKDFLITHNTFISMSAVSIKKKKFGVLILPRYVSKWIGDITELTDIKAEEILVIQGLFNLIKAMTIKDLSKYKCFILSLTTVSAFIKSFNNNTDVVEAGLEPGDITKLLKIDTIVSDETHQEFFSVYRFMLYNNHNFTLGLTATLLHNDRNVNQMYELGFPISQRISSEPSVKDYTTTLAVRFTFKSPGLISSKSNFGYSHHSYEKSIRSSPMILHNYLNMIHSLSNRIYYSRRRGNEKLIIFMGSVKMCILTVNFLRRQYHGLAITKYTEEDDYEVINKSSIIITTMKSLGAAVDVPNLISVIQTVNTDSKQDNEQSHGRLREIKGRETIFAHIWTPQIRAHNRYNVGRYTLFKRLSKVVKAVNYTHVI